MIELDEIDRYAGAALFSLALLYYGPRRDLIHDLVDQEYDPQRDPQLALICSRLYRKLGVAPGRWPGLLQLPSICENHPQEAFVLIKRYRSFFDPPAAPAQPGAWSLADLIVDPEQQHAQQHLLGQPTHKSVVMVYELMGSCLASKEDDVIMREAMAATAATAQPSDAGASGGGSGTAPHAAPYPGSPPAAGSASSSDGANKQETGGSSGGGGGMTHLYDSRARMALRRVCAWLRVPQTKLLAFEQMWAGELLRLQHTSEGPSLKVGNRFTNAFKVGAAAVGGGALLALTGGIAAPAVAAALVPLFTSIGGVAAGAAGAASTVAAFTASTAGAAAITTTFGVLGAAKAGMQVSDACKDIEEFGFLDVTESIHLDEQSTSRRRSSGSSRPVSRTPSSHQVACGSDDGSTAEGGSGGGSRRSTAGGVASGGGSGSGAGGELPHRRTTGDSAALTPSVSAAIAAAVSVAAAPEEEAEKELAETTVSTGAQHVGAEVPPAAAPPGGQGAAPAEERYEAGDAERQHEEFRLLATEAAVAAPDGGLATGSLSRRTSQLSLAANDPAAVGRSAAGGNSVTLSQPPGTTSASSSSWDLLGLWPGGGTAAGTAGGGGRKPGVELRPLLPLPVNPRKSDHASLALTIGVNGWAKDREDFVRPWRKLPGTECDRFALVFQSAEIISLSTALVEMLKTQAMQEVRTAVIRVAFSSVAAALSAMALPLAAMTAADVVFGSRWNKCLLKAKLAGKVLAELLARGLHGGRPVTLVGSSLGARAVFHCLLELHARGARGIVDHVVLLGCPVSLDEGRWERAASVVAGRFINGYTTNDWVLGIMYKVHSAKGLMMSAAGLRPVEGIAGVTNVDLSSIVDSHDAYLEKMPEVLAHLGLVESLHG